MTKIEMKEVNEGFNVTVIVKNWNAKNSKYDVVGRKSEYSRKEDDRFVIAQRLARELKG